MVTYPVGSPTVLMHHAEMKALLVLSMSLAACATSGPCVDRVGSYIVDFDERDGTCGQINETVVNIGSGGAPTSCTGNNVASTDNCSIDANIQCPTSDGDTLIEVGQITWNGDGSSGSGTIAISLLDPGGNALCEGTYDVHYNRQ